jgi:hypothetical protein
LLYYTLKIKDELYKQKLLNRLNGKVASIVILIHKGHCEVKTSHSYTLFTFSSVKFYQNILVTTQVVDMFPAADMNNQLA